MIEIKNLYIEFNEIFTIYSYTKAINVIIYLIIRELLAKIALKNILFHKNDKN